jgi:hypothetical protein
MNEKIGSRTPGGLRGLGICRVVFTASAMQKDGWRVKPGVE